MSPGPAFTPWSGEPPSPPTTGADGGTPGSAPLRAPAPPAPDLSAFQPVPSRLSAGLTALALSLVAAVVLAATLLTREPAARVEVSASAAPTAAATPSRPAVPVVDTRSIEMSSTRGAGRLKVLSHSWSSMDRKGSPSRSGSTGARSRLRIEVELLCSRGEIAYDPYSFQVFDAGGKLFEVADARADSGLESGKLAAGERVRGVVIFALPRGAVTLMMTEDATQMVTALRIAG